VLEGDSVSIVPRVVSVALRSPAELVVSPSVVSLDVPLAEVVDVLVASVEIPDNPDAVDGEVPVVVVGDVSSEAAVAFVVSSLFVAAELDNASKAAVGVAAKVVVDGSPVAEEVVGSVALPVLLEGVPVASVVVSVDVSTELVAAVPSDDSVNTLVAEVASASSVVVDLSGKKDTVVPSVPSVDPVAWT
jgi:hypothetical protein